MLPSEVVKQIIQYLSPVDLAKVAQVNKAWNQVVYSDTCWNVNKLWEIKPGSYDEFYSGIDIPAYARHIGEPTELCFYDWMLQSKSIHVPFCVLEIANFDLYIHYFKQLWIRQGKPCIHTTHHKWYDVYRGRAFLQLLDPLDQQRVFYKHCRFTIDREVVDTNSYRFWLIKHLESNKHVYVRLTISDIPPSSNHPADIITAKQRIHELKRQQYILDKRQVKVEHFQLSIRNLRPYGKKSFDKKDLTWSELFT